MVARSVVGNDDAAGEVNHAAIHDVCASALKLCVARPNLPALEEKVATGISMQRSASMICNVVSSHSGLHLHSRRGSTFTERC